MSKKLWIIGSCVFLGLIVIIAVVLLERYDYRVVTSEPSNAYLKKHIRKYGVQGIDVSHHQGAIDWERVKHPDSLKQLKFVFIRATVGLDQDKRFKENWDGVGDRKIARGAYHYYWADVNSNKQAENFLATVHLVKGDLPPVLDIEDVSTKQDITSLRKGLKNWISIVEKKYGTQPILYTSDSFYKDFLKPDSYFKNYQRLWIANYNGVNQPRSKWNFWQFTDRLPVEGIETLVDGNVYKEDLETFKKLLIP